MRGAIRDGRHYRDIYRFFLRISTDKRACSYGFPGIHLILELSRYADFTGLEFQR